MQFKTLFILFNVLSSLQGVNGLIEDQNDGKPVPVSQPDDVIQAPETPDDVKFTEINFNEGKSNKLGVHDIEDQDNEPTPQHAKKPISPYGAEGSSNEEEAKQPWDSFIMSVSMIIVSEIGDKTFLIAALMAMRYSRVVVFAAAFSSLAIMTVLSGIVGHALPSLLSKRVTQFLASVLFIVFGYKLLREGLSMSKDVGVDEELAEVEEEIKANDLNNQMDSMESGNVQQTSDQQWYVKFGEQVKDLASFVLSPIFIQVFVMTFLGEWGDRSQIATIALAAGSDYWMVIIGAILGHGVCTFAACMGGKLLAKKISMRNVTLGGAISFFLFSILYFYEAYYDAE
ncbi:GCR1-dependent translation factor 1 [[Candida] jaroonii]|uniref:GCR1-dependent translation factor 1 n=1 Tax=[Candida] jaroonii TaxID=467808 RepID=A0ACA9YFI8_9ASCO|nr:GCR1-dependent translation factor 1 [[Candida] jaroonii]